jgi:xanthine dehydrogenase YagR molybdenum-binding subunit
MGVPLEKVAVRLGDSDFPVSCGSGGQWGGNNSTAGVYAACVKLRDSIAQKLGFNSEEAMFSDGMVRAGNRSVPLAQGRPGRHYGGGRHRIWRPRRDLSAVDLRRAFR